MGLYAYAHEWPYKEKWHKYKGEYIIYKYIPIEGDGKTDVAINIQILDKGSEQ